MITPTRHLYLEDAHVSMLSPKEVFLVISWSQIPMLLSSSILISASDYVFIRVIV